MCNCAVSCLPSIPCISELDGNQNLLPLFKFVGLANLIFRWCLDVRLLIVLFIQLALKSGALPRCIYLKNGDIVNMP